MIAGLPWESWLLLLVSVGLGLGIEIAFFRAHRKERRERPVPDPGGGERAGSRSGFAGGEGDSSSTGGPAP